MIYGSLFSGAGGFDLGLDAAGMTCAFQCEIDKQARAVLRHHWPEVPKHADVRELSGRTLPRIDLLVGGFPCQDVSVAGNRAGLAGKRTGLFYEFTRLVSELAPEWLLLENVPGLLSSGGGRDMGAVLWALGELGYGWAYRSLDAQYDGVPQRRERVFIVGRAGGRSPVEVLFEPESVPGNPPPRRKEKEDVAGTLGGVSPGGGFATDTDRMTFVAMQCHGSNVGPTGALRSGHNEGGGVPFVARTLTAHGRRQDGETESFVTAPLTTRPYHKGICSRIVAQEKGEKRPYADKVSDETRLVAHTLRAEGFDAGEDGTGRGTPLVPVAFNWYASESQSMPTDAVCPPIKTTMQPAVFSDPRRHDENHRGGMRERPSLNASNNDLVLSAGVRRLTPLECERLMGWPDGHTLHGVTDDGKAVTMADGPRYRMCGNGVVAPVATWIGKRIAEGNKS